MDVITYPCSATGNHSVRFKKQQHRVTDVTIWNANPDDDTSHDCDD